MDLKLKPESEKTRVRRRPYPAPQEQVGEIERQIQECIELASLKNIRRLTTPITAVPASLLLNLDRLPWTSC